VLAVITDREGRWWRAMECCSRCAAADATAKIVATAPAADRPSVSASDAPAAGGRASTALRVGPQFSHTPSPAATASEMPAPRSVPARRRPKHGKIAQRVIPHDLHPTALRDELIELGDQFRAYQQRTEPDLALLADLHTRKAHAFAIWAEVTCDTGLRLDAKRAEQAAATALLQHRQRTGRHAEGHRPAVARLLTGPAQWEHARSVLAHVADHTPLSGAQARLLVLMLTLRTAHTGVGNLVGQDLSMLPLTEPEQLIERLVGCGWLRLPGTAGDLLASRPENATRITVPSLMPKVNEPGPFTFGKHMRPKLSGWAQKVVGDKKLRKTKATADVRLLALNLATQTSHDGRLGPFGQGLALEPLASRCAVEPGELRALVDQLTTAEWLTDAVITDTHLTGRLTERVLPLTCPLP
jgi:hypothetical protein